MSPDSTQYKFQYALDMWNEFNIDGLHELASGQELIDEVKRTCNEHSVHLGKLIKCWKDSDNRLQYTIKG